VLKILYFAWVRERIGLDEELVEPPPQVATVAELALWLAQRSDGHAAAFSDLTKLRAAVDQRFSGLDGSIEGAEEVAYFPPVTGG
jgi:sulfur-carrier protein